MFSKEQRKQEIPTEEEISPTVHPYMRSIPFSRGSREKAVPNDAILSSPFFNVSKQTIFNYSPKGEKLLVVFAVTVDSRNVRFFLLLNI